MQFHPSAEFVMPHQRVQARLYDAVELLRVIETKLEGAIDRFADARQTEYISPIDLIECQASAKLFANVFQEIIGCGKPTLPDRVFRAIAELTNRHPENIPNIEGIMIGLELAHQALCEAIDLSAELDGTEIDEGYELMIAARASVGYFISFFPSTTLCFHEDQVMAAILEGRPVPSLDKLHDEWRTENFPDGIPARLASRARASKGSGQEIIHAAV